MHVNQTKWRENDGCWRLILVYSGTCCTPLVLWLSIATFNDAKPRLKVVSCLINEICCKHEFHLGYAGYPNTNVAKYDPRGEGYTGRPAVGNNFRLYKNNADLQNNSTLPWYQVSLPK